MTLSFVELTESYAKSFADALREGLFIQPWPKNEIDEVENNFRGWRSKALDLSKPIVLPDGSKVPRVPQTTRWLVRPGQFLGICGIRHFLTESLKSYGGHIGYALRAAERKKGLGRLLLLEELRVAGGLALKEVILTCNADNEPSIRIIESCDGNLLQSVNLSFREVPHNIYRIVLSDEHTV